MTERSEIGSAERTDLAQRLLGLVNSSWMSQATYVAAQLRIPDLLADGPKTVEELAMATSSHGPSLRRLLRALTTIEICSEHEDGSFALLPMGALLRSEAAESLRAWTILVNSYNWPVWGNLLYSVETGKSARTLLTGTEEFQHLEQDPALAALFNQAMVEITRLIVPGVVQAYDFSGMSRIVDVGGGYGELLAAILKANPAAHGVLFDLPHAIDNGRRHLESAGLTQRCSFVAGNFFESIPSGADGYVLKSIIHDWNDERSQVILENCQRAIGPSGRLLLVERIMPERLEASPAHQSLVRSDLNMMIALAAQERSEAEFRRLLSAAGFYVTQIVPVGFTFSIIEAVPAH
jgi:ubiquinone/menaquinone biosynthesis C-methylase UbiE